MISINATCNWLISEYSKILAEEVTLQDSHHICVNGVTGDRKKHYNNDYQCGIYYNLNNDIFLGHKISNFY